MKPKLKRLFKLEDMASKNVDIFVIKTSTVVINHLSFFGTLIYFLIKNILLFTQTVKKTCTFYTKESFKKVSSINSQQALMTTRIRAKLPPINPVYSTIITIVRVKEAGKLTTPPSLNDEL